MRNLRFFDPACGCGNFLVIGYRELRELELEVLKELFGKPEGELTLAQEISKLSQVDVDQFYGIEIEEWPARIAEVALWLMDHQIRPKSLPKPSASYTSASRSKNRPPSGVMPSARLEKNPTAITNAATSSAIRRLLGNTTRTRNNAPIWSMSSAISATPATLIMSSPGS